MKTKERILATALELFNSEGLKEVTLRRIAGEMGISQGNLNYHYKAKADIVSALYYQLVDRMNLEMEKITQEQPILLFLYQSSLISMKTLFEYQFITKDLYTVLATDDQLKEHYLGLQEIRKTQFLLLFQNMITTGLLRNEEFEGEYDRLYKRMNILGDNWINAATLFEDKKPSSVEYYHQLLFEVMYPYLTEKGKEEYHQVV